MFHYWLHRNLVLKTTDIYLQANHVGIKDCLQLAAANSTIDFRSIGGYDKNESWMEHSIIENTTERNDTLSWPLQIYDMNTKPALIQEKLESIPFSIFHFAFECSDTIWMRGDGRYGQSYIKIDMPMKEEEMFIEKFGNHFPFIKKINEWNIPSDKYFVADEDSVNAIFTGVDSLFDFQEENIYKITGSFNQNF